MKSTDKHIHLFGPSGCVNESAFFSYLNHELNSAEMHAIESHLSECLFCSDAIEGYEKQTNIARVKSDLQAIKKEFLLKQNKQPVFKKKDNKRYLVLAVSIAASFILIISGYYLFQILPTSDKKSELAVQSPVQKNDIPEIQTLSGPKAEDIQEEKSGSKDNRAINMVSQPEFQQKVEKKTKADQIYGYFDKSEDLKESDGDVISRISATGKGVEYKSGVNAETTKALEQNAVTGVVKTEDAENDGQISDVTVAMDPQRNLKQESVPVMAKTTVDEVLPDNNFRSEEKVVSGNKNRSVVIDDNKKQPSAAVGGVSKSTMAPSFSNAITLYNTGNYDQALSQFEYTVEHENNNYAAMYYLAMCHYYKGEKDSALIQLAKLVKKKNNPFYELGMWQKAQIVEESDKKQATEIYREIIKYNGSMKTQAVQKVDELEK